MVLRLFFDEDMGKGVAEALRSVGYHNEVDYLRNHYRNRLRKRGANPVKDEEWLPLVGRSGWLAFSCNVGILAAEAQREIVIREKVGIVFLTSGKEKSVDVLKLVLRKWDWFQMIDRNEPRPFAFLLTLGGKTIRDPRVR